MSESPRVAVPINLLYMHVNVGVSYGVMEKLFYTESDQGRAHEVECADRHLVVCNRGRPQLPNYDEHGYEGPGCYCTTWAPQENA